MEKNLFNKKFVKVITGINNFKLVDVIKKIKAADISGATYVDVAAHPDIVSAVKSITHLPVCVSSIDPQALYTCVLAGADIIEIGNFETFYNKNIYFSVQQIVDIVKETKALINSSIICVTIPYTFTLVEQIQLAINLEVLGINAIQTEGKCVKNANIKYIINSYAFNIAHTTSCTFSSTYILSHATNLPIISASGIDAISSTSAISYGASGIGIGSALNQFNTIHQMAKYIKEITISFDFANCNSNNQIKKNPKLDMVNDLYVQV